MKIGVDARVLLRTGNGINRYSQSLLEALMKIDQENMYVLYLDCCWEKVFGNTAKFKQQVIDAHFSWPLRLYSQIKRDKIHLLFSPSPSFPIVKVCKSVVTIHDLNFEVCPRWYTFKSYLYLTAVFRLAAQNADKIIAISESSKKDIVKYYRVPESKIKVVYNGVDHSRFRPIANLDLLDKVKRKYGINTNYILYVGAISLRKNISSLLKAFRVVRQQLMAPPKLVLAGREIEPWINLPKLVKNLGLQDSVVRIDFHEDDLPLLYNAADFFVYPSLYEGFGLPILEAMACGIPVLASRSSSIPEVVGDAGILVDPYDSSGLAKEIYELSTDENLRLRLSESSLKRSKLFTWERTAKETLAAYNEVVPKY